MFNVVKYAFRGSARLLATHGLIDRRRGEQVADLAWPRFLTMFARVSQRVADISMVGLSVGPLGIAGLAFASVYWTFAAMLGTAISGGTINQVAQRYGADQPEQLELAFKQGAWVGLVLTLPFVVVLSLAATDLIRIFTSSPEIVRHGAEYLRIIALGLLFVTLNLTFSRTLAGADDTRIAMGVRATGSVVNIVLNGVFIFGFGMGAAGAALGTVLSELLVTGCFAWGFVAGRLPIVGPFPVRLSFGPPYVDLPLTRQLLRISTPILIQNVGRGIALFPLYALLAFYGPTAVAAFEVARRIRSLMGAFGAGFSMSASSLVGQVLGRGDEEGATRFSRDIITFSATVYLLAAGVLVATAPLVARLFTDDPATLAETVPFVRIAAISFLGYGAVRTFEGILRAAGDNEWAMYGWLVGQYLVLLPLVYVGTITPLGIVAVYLAFIAETWSSAAITGRRVRSGRWRVVSRSYRPKDPAS